MADSPVSVGTRGTASGEEQIRGAGRVGTTLGNQKRVGGWIPNIRGAEKEFGVPISTLP